MVLVDGGQGNAPKVASPSCKCSCASPAVSLGEMNGSEGVRLARWRMSGAPGTPTLQGLPRTSPSMAGEALPSSMPSSDAQIGNAVKVGSAGNADPATPELSFDAPWIGNIRGCLKSSMGGK